MRKERTTKPTLLIICEGDTTEPLFFGSIRSEILAGNFIGGQLKVSIQPEPTTKEEKEEESSFKPKRKERTTANVDVPAFTIVGQPPLSWVNAAKAAINEGSYDEVWVVFDHDRHPARKEAFEEAENPVNGKKVNIAFTSIAFEYYLLIHFERIYRDFHTSECRKGSKPIYCSLKNPKDDCGGDRCIGGYARLKKYWSLSKDSNTSIYPIIKDKLDIGFLNACWLRNKSEEYASGVPIYERNPYITSDRLVYRLVYNGNKRFHFAVLNTPQKLSKIELIFTNLFELYIKNVSNDTIVIPKDTIQRITSSNQIIELLGPRKVLYPGDSFSFDFTPQAGDNNNKEYIFSFDNDQVLYCPQ